MWSDDWFYELDPSEKLLWVFLLTNPRQNVAGIFEASLSWICSYTGFDKQVVEMILRRFEETDKIRRHKNWIVIVNHYKHQSLSPKIEEGIARIIKDIPPEIRYIYPIHMVCIRYRTLLNLTSLFSEQSSENEKDMGWNKYSDDYEEGVVDLESGELHDPVAEEKEKDKELNAKFRASIDWLIRHQGRDPKRTPIPKQLKAIKKLYTMGVSAAEAKQIIIECEGSDVWRGKQEKPDFWTVVSIIQKRG